MIWDVWHPVQAHSSVLWAYLLRLLSSLGLSIEDAAKLLGISFGSLSVMVVTVTLWSTLNLKRLLVAVALLATFPPLVLWSSAGLETTLALCLGLHFVSLVGRACEKSVRPPMQEAELLTAVLLGVISPLVRPDLPLQLLGGLLCLFVWNARARRLIPVVAVSAYRFVSRAALERYGQTIINAYGDIVGSLDTFNTLGSRNVALKKASDAAQEVLRLGELKYQEGSESLLNLFTVRTSAENAESLLIANRRARLEQWIVLHTALGGNPTKATPLATPASTANGKQ